MITQINPDILNTLSPLIKDIPSISLFEKFNKDLNSSILSLQNQFKNFPKLKNFSTTLNLLNAIKNDTSNFPSILSDISQNMLTRITTIENFNSMEAMFLSHVNSKFGSMAFSLTSQLSQFDKSIGNYFSRIRLQIGAECSLAISDVLKETKFQARNLRDAMKSVGKDLLEIAVNFQDSADIFELKADNVFSKIKTFLLDLEIRLNQVLTTNAMKIIEAFNPLPNHLEDSTSTILERITDLSTSTSDKL
jgi:hypothetical protein